MGADPAVTGSPIDHWTASTGEFLDGKPRADDTTASTSFLGDICDGIADDDVAWDSFDDLRPVSSFSSVSSLSIMDDAQDDVFRAYDMLNADFQPNQFNCSLAPSSGFVANDHRHAFFQEASTTSNMFAMLPAKRSVGYDHRVSAPVRKNRAPTNSRYNTKVACVRCSQHKLGCDQQRPCQRCVATNNGDSCVDRPHAKRRRRSAQQA
ncbi:Zn(2)-C6 fungal-type domain-containing protein [Plasmodiophora brassicae]